jgi:mono/diheme cytochrome c family protein
MDNDGKKIINEQVYFENKFGRIRDLCVSPAGDVYLATSNRDWNPVSGFPLPSDDRIIKISKLDASNPQNMVSSIPPGSKSAQLYQQYCASCHKDNGMGVKDVFPSLLTSLVVVNNPKDFIKKVLTGSNGPATINGVKYDTPMPSFAFLKDEELIDVMTYVRSLGSNHAIPFKPELIKEVRTSLNK